MVISGEALNLCNIHTDTNFASKSNSSKISPHGSKPLRTSRMANPYTDNMDLDEVMNKTEDSTSDLNDSRKQTRQSQRRNRSLKVICVDKIKPEQKEYSDKPKESTNEIKTKASGNSEKQIKRQH